MASVAELAYTIAAVKRIDYSPIFQSFKNKNSKTKEHSRDRDIAIH